MLVLSAMRHDAERPRRRGFEADYTSSPDYSTALLRYIRIHNPDRIVTMAGGEYGLSRFQTDKLPGVTDNPVAVIPDPQFLTKRHDPFAERAAGRKLVMETFYREMRRHFGVRMGRAGSSERAGIRAQANAFLEDLDYYQPP